MPIVSLSNAEYFERTKQAYDDSRSLKEKGTVFLPTPDFKNISLKEGMEIEALRWKYPSAFVFGTNTVSNDGGAPLNGAAAVGFGGWTVPLGKLWYLESVSGYVSDPIVLQVDSGAGNSGKRVIVNGNFFNPVNKLAFSGDQIFASSQGPLSPTTLKIVSIGQWEGNDFSSDVNYEAKNTVLFLGDSNTEGTSVQNGKTQEDLYSQQLINWLNTQGFSCRRVDKSKAGKSSTDFNNYLNAGKLNVSAPALIIDMLGTNDLTGTGAEASSRDTSIANLENRIAWRKARYPNAIHVVCSPFIASSGSAKELWLANFLRPAIQAKVAALSPGDPKLFYCDMANVTQAPYNFTNNNDAFFSTNDSSTPGNRIHHNKAGHEKDFQRIRDFFTTNNLVNTLKTLNP